MSDNEETTELDSLNSREVVLTKEQFEQFTDYLEKDPAPNPRLALLFKQPSVLEF